MCLIDALHCRNRAAPPIWLMRQAGRFLPTYRTFKEKQSLLAMFHDPETIVKVTQLPFSFLNLDAAILFSDILTVLDGLGVPYSFEDQIGPVIQFNGFKPKENAYEHITQAIHELKKVLKVPLLGFAGAPFTIVSYLIEGKTSKNFHLTKKRLFQDPEGFQQLLDCVTEETLSYLDLQIDAGVDAVQIFDSWANILPLNEFRRFCLKPMARIVAHVKARGIPIILFCRGSSFLANELSLCAPSAISIDWGGDLPQIRKQIPRTIALQGNLDPALLYGSQESIKRAADPLIDQMAGDPGYIFNLGHGILPDTPFENVQFLVNYVKDRFQAALQTA